MRRWPAHTCFGKQVSFAAISEAHFERRSGLHTAHHESQQIVLDFPALPPVACEPLEGLLDLLGAPVRYLARHAFDLLVELEDEAAVRGLRPNLERLAALPVRGVIVTSRSQDLLRIPGLNTDENAKPCADRVKFAQ